MRDNWDAIDYQKCWWNNLSFDEKVREVDCDSFPSLIQIHDDIEEIWNDLSEEKRLKLLEDIKCRHAIIANEFPLEEIEENFINLINL